MNIVSRLSRTFQNTPQQSCGDEWPEKSFLRGFIPRRKVRDLFSPQYQEATGVNPWNGLQYGVSHFRDRERGDTKGVSVRSASLPGRGRNKGNILGGWLPMAVVVLVGAVCIYHTPRSLTWPVATIPTLSNTLKHRLYLEVREMNWYWNEGSWFRRGYLPYLQAPYEYPVLATALFTFPVLFSDNVVVYHVLFRIILTLSALLLLWCIIRRSIPSAHAHLAWLLVLPSALYATFNRFDIVVALAVQCSLYALYRRRWHAAFILLAIAILLKWYAGLLFPLYVFVLFDEARTREERRRGFAAMCLGLAFLVVGHVWPLLLNGDLLTMVNPYAIHFVRSPEIGSFMALFGAPFGKFYSPSYQLEPGNVDGLTAAIVTASSLLQWAGLVVLLWALVRRPRRLESLQALAHAAFICVGTFILFNRVYSFQWILWFVPFIILTLPTRATVVGVVLYDVISYIQFPLLYGLFGDAVMVAVFSAFTLVRSALLVVLLLPSFCWLFRSFQPSSLRVHGDTHAYHSAPS
ncbi:MAG: hypothetical protein AB1352_03975 [Patescibacteria group bacterium]